MIPPLLDIPRAIPAADPFDPLPEPAEIGLAMQAKREELLSGGVDPVELEATLQVWAKAALPIEDHRPDPVIEPVPVEPEPVEPEQEAGSWETQPRDALGRFAKKDTTDGA